MESVKLGGKEIDPNATYKVCTIDYLSNTNHYLGEYLSRKDSEEYLYDLFCDHVRKLTDAGKNVTSSLDSRVTVVK